jgi:hypothetical protein
LQERGDVLKTRGIVKELVFFKGGCGNLGAMPHNIPGKEELKPYGTVGTLRTECKNTPKKGKI